MTNQNPLLMNILTSQATLSNEGQLNTNPVTSDTNPSKTAIAFQQALEELDIHSVFDIIRHSKSDFCSKLYTLGANNSSLNDVSAELTYDNAMCYAIQIGRLYREQQVSSRDAHPMRSGAAGVLNKDSADYPGYENLFKEQWGEFCKVGALSAVDSPVAYLRSLYRLITTVVEPGGEGTGKKITLEDRRPDLKNLLVDQHTTFTPLPMLRLANDIIRKNIEDFLGKDAKTLPAKMASKRHPFLFPYHFAHHQCLLGLDAAKSPLGEINYQASRQLPTLRDGSNGFGKHNALSSAVAQGLLCGLSPEQQKLLTEKTLFSDFYISRMQLEAGGWYSPGASAHFPWQELMYGFVIPPQDSVVSITPDASVLTPQDNNAPVRHNTVELSFNKQGSNPAIKLTFDFSSNRANFEPEPASVITSTYNTNYMKTLCIRLKPGQTLPTDKQGYTATFYAFAIADKGYDVPATGTKTFIKRSFTIFLDDASREDYLPTEDVNRETYGLGENEKQFFKRHYGIELSYSGINPLNTLTTFMKQTELDADAVEALLAVRRYAPNVSINCISKNPTSTGSSSHFLKFPYASHYGAGYINGVGATSSETVWADAKGNFMGLKEIKTPETTAWHFTNTSLNRFDRMQRMIRLQRWMDIPFTELDTLIVAAMRAEGDANPQMALNENTLRTLGVFRHLSQRYSIKAEEFAAFLYYLSPYANAERTPLFDEVFNSPALFDTPLVLDQTPFDIFNDNPEDQKTVYQLCAGLGLQATEASLGRLVENTKTHVKTLTRSLDTVSSLYRQARIAQMFGLSVEDSGALADLLGGDAFHKALASGALRTEGDAPDILDILMQMDWAVTWIKDSKQTISTVRTQIGLDPSTLIPKQALVDRLERLYQDTQPTLITAQQVDDLNLPNTASGSIDWLAEIKRALASDIGLVKALPMQQINDVEAQLNQELKALIQPFDLSAEDQIQAQEKLCELLTSAHDRQLRLIEGLLQEVANLPMERTAVVTHWAELSIEALLSAVDKAGKESRLTLRNFDPHLLESLQTLLRHAHIAHSFNLSEPALRMFLAEPTLLGTPLTDTRPSLASFYLLERYSHMVDHLNEPEVALLNYLSLANFNAPTDDIAEKLIQELAKLLGWNKSETLTLVSSLPDHQATTLAQVEWVYRCKKLCATSGLTASDLLCAIALHTDSPAADWTSMGEAAMAANR